MLWLSPMGELKGTESNNTGLMSAPKSGSTKLHLKQTNLQLLCSFVLAYIFSTEVNLPIYSTDELVYITPSSLTVMQIPWACWVFLMLDKVKSVVFTACMYANECVLARVLLVWLRVFHMWSVALWQPTSVVQDPTLPSFSFPLVCKRSILWNIDRMLHWELTALHCMPRAKTQLWSSDQDELSMSTPCSMLLPGACHVTMRHLHLAACVSSRHAHYHSLCYLWEPVRSAGGWLEVGEVYWNTAVCILL